MAKLVDALDLGSSGATHRSSSLLTRTTIFLFCASDNFAIGDYEAKRSGTRSETSGQIGRRTGFRFQRGKQKEFKSPYPHQI